MGSYPSKSVPVRNEERKSISFFNVPARRPSSERIYNSKRIDGGSVNLDFKPTGEGFFRWIALGEYTTGPNQSKISVCKWFKHDYVEHSLQHFYSSRDSVKEMATNIIEDFQSLCVCPFYISLNHYDTIICDELNPSGEGVTLLAQPFLENFQKFNSNTGWVLPKETQLNQVLQAISHFSYHASNGTCLLCDLQGIQYFNFFANLKLKEKEM